VSSPAIFPTPPQAGERGDADWRSADDEWGGTALTERELTQLAAWDRAGAPADEPDEDEEWLAELPPEQWEEPAEAGPEALPGLMPRRWGTGGGFDAGGLADAIPPGPVLAGLAAGKHETGLARVSEDELAGLMIAWRRIASWAAAGELAAIAELDRRRTTRAAMSADAHLAEHVADEVAMVLTLTSRAAGKLTDFALSLAKLPKTRSALWAGHIDAPKALVIIDELTGLDGPHAARVEAAVIGCAPGQTTGELRRTVRRAVIAADPDSARRRKNKAAKDARVECWQEQAGTTALAGRDLPPAEALAADQRISAYARGLKNAGADGTLDGLRAKVYLALLNGQPVASLLPVAEERAETAGTGKARPGQDSGLTGAVPDSGLTGAVPDSGLTGAVPDSGLTGAVPGSGLTGAVPGSGLTGAVPGSGLTGAVLGGALPDGAQSDGVFLDSASPAPGSAALRWALKPGMRGTVNLVLPLATWLGWSQVPGEVTGFGPLDAEDSRASAAALARDPATRWCLTIVGADGRAIAHGCAKGAPVPTAPEYSARAGTPGQPPGETARQPRAQGPRAGPGPPPGETAGRPRAQGPRVGPGLPASIASWLAGIGLTWLETGTCSHRAESAGYRPSPSLAHLIQIRQQRCTAPGCRRPASSCDFEHTIPWHRGGRTCLCNGGPCCRRHHRCKQANGWGLSQPRPGEFIWTTPHGRSYRTEPEPYPA
jgi:hypothetical protein